MKRPFSVKKRVSDAAREVAETPAGKILLAHLAHHCGAACPAFPSEPTPLALAAGRLEVWLYIQDLLQYDAGKVARILRDQVGVAARDPRRERSMKTSLPLADLRSGPVTAAGRPTVARPASAGSTVSLETAALACARKRCRKPSFGPSGSRISRRPPSPSSHCHQRKPGPGPEASGLAPSRPERNLFFGRSSGSW